jgi:predicted Zn finger-like uncharacterized protein
MAVLVDCPSCGRRLRVRDALLGKKVKCPQCGTSFAGEAAAPAPPPAPVPVPVSTSVAVAPGAPAPPEERPAPPPEETRCPYCAEPIAADETRCPYCKTDLEGDEDERPWERPGRGRRFRGEQHRGPLVLVLGIVSVVFGVLSPLGICCSPLLASSLIGMGLGIPAWILGRRDLRKMAAGEMDPRGRSQTNTGRICGIIGTVAGAIGFLVLLAIIVFYVVMMILSAKNGGGPPF